MARPLSDDRRAALLAAATTIVAAQGLAASTSSISKAAGVAEGSLFTYFKTKDVLLLELYRSLRAALDAHVMVGFPGDGDVDARIAHVFRRYVDWSVTHPDGRRAMRLVSMSPLGAVVRAETTAPGLFAEMERVQRDAIAAGTLRLSPAIASAALKAMLDLTIDLVERSPDRSPRHIDALVATGLAMLQAALRVAPPT